MSNNRILTYEEEQDLELWLNMKQIHLNHRTRRHLSNVVNVAQLYKNILGKSVNLQNYTSHGNFELKLLNWEAFNLKVLKRTGLTLNRTLLADLTDGKLDALKYLLFHLMRLEKGVMDDNADAAVLQVSLTRARSQPDPVEFQQAGRAKKTGQSSQPDRTPKIPPKPSRTPRKELKSNQSKVGDSVDKNTVRMLIDKVKYYQDVVQKKDQRIELLVSHLAKLTSRIMDIKSARSDSAILDSNTENNRSQLTIE